MHWSYDFPALTHQYHILKLAKSLQMGHTWVNARTPIGRHSDHIWLLNMMGHHWFIWAGNKSSSKPMLAMGPLGTNFSEMPTNSMYFKIALCKISAILFRRQCLTLYFLDFCTLHYPLGLFLLPTEHDAPPPADEYVPSTSVGVQKAFVHISSYGSDGTRINVREIYDISLG